MTDQQPIEKTYDPTAVESEMYRLWEQAGAFVSRPDGRPHEQTFTIVIPPPNVTGALHLGHALNNTLQDILVRYHRMRGFNTLWQPGTDHAGIATQAVVERRIRETEGKTRHQLGATEQEAREELVRRIWQWKDEYEKRILNQLKLMGCSCDWSRNRFTLDEGLARAVRQMFFDLFQDGLIFRGKRLVNWDTQLQTAVSDDEVYHETVKGHFWHIRYPVIRSEPPASARTDARSASDEGELVRHEGTKANRHEGTKAHRHDVGPSRERSPVTSQSEVQGTGATSPSPLSEGGPDEPEFVVIATTRPETMLGDVAVAVHPDPEGFFGEQEARLRDEFARTTGREQQIIKAKLEVLAERRDTDLPRFVRLRDMARAGRKLRLPLVDREIPLITDEWADPTLGTGCVKITPAHDPNDYEVGLRHKLPMINVLTADGKIAPIVEPDPAAAPCKPGTAENAHSDEYAGLPFSTEGRAKVVADLEAHGLIDHVEDRDIELGHSDRSKLPIEPYLSDQWFLQTSDIDEMSRLRRGGQITDKANYVTLANGSRVSGLAQAAIDAVRDKRINVFPERYSKSYVDWLREKRDWCVSRQLWWGHRIPVWRPRKEGRSKKHDSTLRIPEDEHGRQWRTMSIQNSGGTSFVCLLDDNTAEFFISGGHVQDPDVLDTWFSSALWPFSTLGWPEETPHLKQYYPGSVLCTSRDIITNWVARMVMFGLYAMGEVPFDHVYIHPKILDGRGETMSKSKGNGVDPVDIIHTHGADALRYTLADMTTETQDIRMPVEYVCPHCGHLVDQSVAIKNEEQARKSRGQKLERKLQPADVARIHCPNKECGKAFATQWADPALKEELGVGRETSDKFEIGRNFCNKLWNAARFAFMNLAAEAAEATERWSDEATMELAGATLPSSMDHLLPEDRWILARLSQSIRRYHELIAQYQFAASVKELRDFFWDCLCDWYLELTKARLSDEATERSAGGEDASEPDRSLRSNPITESDSRTTAREVLAFCLDQVLRLWHPTIPFITERLWQQLNEIVPRRGLAGIIELQTDGPLISAAFPPVEGYPALDDDEMLATFATLQDATRGVRDLRSASNVPPRERVTVTVVVPPDRLAAFRDQAHVVGHMAGIGELHVVTTASRPKNAAGTTLGALRIFVHDISDDEAERERATRALVDVERQIAGKESKLANEKFVNNAKPEVVEAERGRLAELLAQRDSLKSQLADLAGGRR